MRGREEVEGDSLLHKLQEQWLMTDTQITGTSGRVLLTKRQLSYNQHIVKLMD